jgi:hypothetical protein
MAFSAVNSMGSASKRFNPQTSATIPAAMSAAMSFAKDPAAAGDTVGL